MSTRTWIFVWYGVGLFVSVLLVFLLMDHYYGLILFAWAPAWAVGYLVYRFEKRQLTKLPPTDELDKEFQELVKRMTK